MRIHSPLSAIALAGGLLIAPAAVVGAEASSAAACQYRQSGNHWVCVTPGSTTTYAAP